MDWNEYEVLQAIESGTKDAWETETSYNDGLASRSRRPMILFVKKDAVMKFQGEDIEGVCTILSSSYNKQGKWSSTTYQISYNPDYSPKELRQSWDNGRFVDNIETLETMANDLECQEVEESVFIAFMKEHFPKTWERYEELQKAMGGTEDWEETTFSNGKINNRRGWMNLFVDGEKWNEEDIEGKLVITNRDRFDGRGGGGTNYTIKVAPGVVLERLCDEDIHERESKAKAEESGLPEQLMVAFGGNEDAVRAFMERVASLPKGRVNRHEISCGRGRVRSEIVRVSGNEDFFGSADPNDVKYYIQEVLFGNEDYEDQGGYTEPEEKPDLRFSGGTTLGDLLGDQLKDLKF